MKGKKINFFELKADVFLTEAVLPLNTLINYNKFNLRKVFSKLESSQKNFSVKTEFVVLDYDFFFYICTYLQPAFFYSILQFTYNIYYLDLICSYRGYRHFYGNPVRGQRTWSNATTCFKVNTILRYLKLYFFKKFYKKGSNMVNLISKNPISVNMQFVRAQWEIDYIKLRKKPRRRGKGGKKKKKN